MAPRSGRAPAVPGTTLDQRKTSPGSVSLTCLAFFVDMVGLCVSRDSGMYLKLALSFSKELLWKMEDTVQQKMNDAPIDDAATPTETTHERARGPVFSNLSLPSVR